MISSSHVFASSLSSVNSTYSFSDLILQIIPSNIVAAFSQGQMLGLIFFSLLFGYAITKIQKELTSSLQNFFNALFETMLKITHIILKFYPLGVFCLVAKHVAQTGFETISTLALFVSFSIGVICLFCFVILPLYMKIFVNIPIIKHIKALLPALTTAFTTSSSSASLPIAMECVEKRAGVPSCISLLIVPLGSALNLAASALYTYISICFFFFLHGIDLTLSLQLLLIPVTLLSCMGIAGIPSGAIVAIIVILKGFNIPIENIGLFLAVDRIIDMFRTSGNVFTFSSSAVVLAKSQGTKNILQEKIPI